MTLEDLRDQLRRSWLCKDIRRNDGHFRKWRAQCATRGSMVRCSRLGSGGGVAVIITARPIKNSQDSKTPSYGQRMDAIQYFHLVCISTHCPMLVSKVMLLRRTLYLLHPEQLFQNNNHRNIGYRSSQKSILQAYNSLCRLLLKIFKVQKRLSVSSIYQESNTGSGSACIGIKSSSSVVQCAPKMELIALMVS
jgi:hypothetical protein